MAVKSRSALLARLACVVLLLGALLATAPAMAISFERIMGFEVSGLSLTTPTSRVDAILRDQGFKPDPTMQPKPHGMTHRYLKTDKLIGTKESVELQLDADTPVDIVYQRLFDKTPQHPTSWKDYPFTGEIEYALAVICNSAAEDARDCKDAKTFAPVQSLLNFEVVARRLGGFQRKYILRFKAMPAGYIWQMRRGTPHE